MQLAKYDCTRAHAIACGVPEELGDSIQAAGFSWLQILMLLAKYGPSVWTTIQTDVAAGKTLQQIITDLLAVIQ